MTQKIVHETFLMVKLTEFTAEISDGCVLLKWKTLSETDNAGFHILRSDAVNGEYVRINNLLIPAEGGASFSAAYAFRDCSAVPGKVCYYRLEDTDFRGISTYTEPVSPVSDPVSDNTADADLRKVIRILQINAGMMPPVSENLNEDVTGDGKAGTGDAIWLLRRIRGMTNHK